MKGCLVVGGLGVVLILLVALTWMSMYNGIVARDEACNKAWANVEAVLQRRFDLIPNLVNTVKGYAAHEKDLLEEVTRLRSQWTQAQTAAAKAGAATLLEGALGRLLAVAESYPEVKASANFLALQDELAGTENRISVERQRYNEAVQAYNTHIRQMPTAWIARQAGFAPRTPFEAAPAAAAAPVVQF